MPTAANKASDKSLTIGDAAPAFSMATDGAGNVSLSSLSGKNIALYFYPKDDTPGCTVEAKDFAQLMPEFDKVNTVIIGVSKDSVASHDKFKVKYCLPFTLASDEGSVCEDYGVWTEKSMYGKTYMGVERTTFLIDKAGKIAQVWRKVKVDGHAQEVLAAAKAL